MSRVEQHVFLCYCFSELTVYSVPARKFGKRGTIIEKRALLHVLAESKEHTLYILGEIMVMLFYFLASNSISMQIKLYTGFQDNSGI